jgi:hypothetical protein
METTDKLVRLADVIERVKKRMDDYFECHEWDGLNLAVYELESIQPAMNSKFTFTGETKLFSGKRLQRIKAVKSFSNVLEGELG